jgi:hypothetical protein
MRKISKRAAVIATTATLALGGGAAYAIWAVGGVGAVNATSSSVAPLTATTVNMTEKLYPGVQRSVTVDIKNSNDFPIVVSGLTRGIVDSSDATACSPDYIDFVPSAIPAGTSVGMKSGSTDGTLTLGGVVSMKNDAPLGCASKTFTVHVNVAGQVG